MIFNNTSDEDHLNLRLDEDADNLIDQRDCDRISTPEYTVLYDQIIGKGHGSILDISILGMRMQTLSHVEPGAITLQFKLPAFDRHQIVYGEVIWEERAEFVCGIKFHLSLLTKLPKKMLQKLASSYQGNTKPLACSKAQFKQTFLKPYHLLA